MFGLMDSFKRNKIEEKYFERYFGYTTGKYGIEVIISRLWKDIKFSIVKRRPLGSILCFRKKLIFVSNMYFQTKKLINKFKKKISSHSGCCEQKHKNERDDQKSIISDYLGQRKVFLEKKDPSSISLAIRNIHGNAFPYIKILFSLILRILHGWICDHVDEKFIRSRLGEGKSDKD